ncbi:hypothetical protein Ahy_B09g095850 [Arachis hypogaea]|uniref:RNase H type-1 domain-containing protein n=1 Tax=Arachis hypogaea TaxID=3818 RepID=A0A444XGP9_ARAHY|nr:hypothetical protein Ahy_B09g095850 [Arachis hypogaea]
MNVDAEFKNKEGVAAMVMRDNTGKLLLGNAVKFRAISSQAAEAYAIRQALIIAKNLGMKNVSVESDSLPLIQSIKSRSSIGEVDAILQDIWHLLDSVPGSGLRGCREKEMFWLMRWRD